MKRETIWTDRLIQFTSFSIIPLQRLNETGCGYARTSLRRNVLIKFSTQGSNVTGTDPGRACEARAFILGPHLCARTERTLP